MPAQKSKNSDTDSDSNLDRDESAPKFETALAELESLVTQMESGDLTLDESLKAFERGVTLARQCQQELKHAEQRVQVLTSDGELEDFDDHNE